MRLRTPARYWLTSSVLHVLSQHIQRLHCHLYFPDHPTRGVEAALLPAFFINLRKFIGKHCSKSIDLNSDTLKLELLCLNLNGYYRKVHIGTAALCRHQRESLHSSGCHNSDFVFASVCLKSSSLFACWRALHCRGPKVHFKTNFITQNFLQGSPLHPNRK